MDNKTNEELALIYKHTGNEDAFNEIHKRFERMMKRFYKRHIINNFLEEAELLSCCQVGLYNAVMAYSEDKSVGLSTMIYRYIQTAINNRYDYYMRNGRGYLINHSESIYKLVGNDEDIQLYELLNHPNSEDEYFKDQCVDYKEMINYALSKVNNEEVKPYIIPILIGDYTQDDVAKIIGVKYQAVQYHLKKFKKYIENYIKINKIELEIA
ncbi:hypothetical protein D7X33_28235 [Butyricicoccus sp. 1XD8-22]|nr:hypothetical protein D7X33_28235 [Butyricicoccus sp. 1XD8-22]